MHQYLNAIGFQNIFNKKQFNSFLKEIEHSYSQHELVSLEEDIDFCEYKKEFGDGFGIALCGEISGEEDFEQSYYLPYFKGTGVTSSADIIVEKRIDREAYVGICEDVKVGVSLIFHILNTTEYVKEQQLGHIPKPNTSVTLSGLALSGVILFPIKKDEAQEKTRKEEYHNRLNLMNAAKNGDQQAIESLTLDDIDTYTKVSRRLITEDVFSIVDTYFMPYGVECDHYAILGVIANVKTAENTYTKEKIYKMTLNVNELQFDVCVPVCEVIGEPEIGRRFKANIWLQGIINF